MSTDDKKPKKRIKAGRASYTILALLIGLGFGVFFGEYCSPLKVFGDVFVALLQMTILPYIIVSLIANLGRLSLQQSRRLGQIGGGILLFLWVISLFSVFCFAQAYPSWQGGAFYSTAVVTPPKNFDFVEVFIPSNVFESLSKNHVPAVVLLCICIGIALSSRTDRFHVVSVLDVLAKVLLQISHSIARLTPFGVFAIAAHTAGTISIDQIDRLQAHLIVFSSATLFLGIVVLPWLVSVLTPFGFREVMQITRNAVLTTFATGKLVIVLPMLIDETEKLFERHGFDQKTDSTTAVDVLYPVAYPFPHTGKLLGILFIPFVAWFLGDALTISEYPMLLTTGLFSYFGGPILAMPFLLDIMRLPHDMFQLFLIIGVFDGRLADALGVLHLATFTLISASAFSGRLEWRWGAILRYLVGSGIIGASLIVGLRVSLEQTLNLEDDRENILADMQLVDHPTESTRLYGAIPNPEPLRENESILDRVRRRGILRVGFNEYKIPFAYLNHDGKLVGFDIDMAHALANDMGVKIEFVRFDRATLVEQMAEDHFDIVMSGLVGTLERSQAMAHTEPYLDVTLGLVVPDYRAGSFRTVERISRIKDLRIGFVDLSKGFIARLQQQLPDVELVELPNNQIFFEGKLPGIDALLISAESGSAFTLLYPEFEVVVPPKLKASLPLFYGIGNRDAEMRAFLQHWISLRRRDGTIQTYYDYWILGKSSTVKRPRWCIIRDVLKLVE